MTNPVTFLLGAGAAFPFGVPMMTGFYADFREYLSRRYPHCFTFLERLERAGTHPTRDLETLLSDLSAVVDLNRGLTLLGVGSASHQPDVELARELRGYLDAFIVDTCERFDRASPARELQPLLALHELGPLWVFTTNYDRIIEYACEQSGISWTDGFERPGDQAVADWTGKFHSDVRLVKLHGSVNWYVDDPDRSLHRLDRGYSLPAHDFMLVRGDQRLRPLMIIPTLEKEALGTPYVELSVRFTDVLQESHLLIIAGNSLRDSHIHNYIRARLDALEVLVVSPSATKRMSVLGSSDRIHGIDAGFSEFLSVAGTKLFELGRTMAAQDRADQANRSAVKAFIVSVSQDTLDETTLRKDSDLYRIWSDSKSAVTADRVQAVRDLASHRHPAVARRLQHLLSNDPDEHVRVACVTAFTQAVPDGCVTLLSDALAKEMAPLVQLELALALCRQSHNEKTVDALRHGITRPELSSVARSVINDYLAASSERV